MLRDPLAAICLVTGAGFCVVGGIGLLRLPDVYSRVHGASIIDTLGAALVLIGLMFEPAHWTTHVKLVGILFFLFVTSSTASHALMQAAHSSGVKPWSADDEAASGSPQAGGR